MRPLKRSRLICPDGAAWPEPPRNLMAAPASSITIPSMSRRQTRPHGQSLTAAVCIIHPIASICTAVSAGGSPPAFDQLARRDARPAGTGPLFACEKNAWISVEPGRAVLEITPAEYPLQSHWVGARRRLRHSLRYSLRLRRAQHASGGCLLHLARPCHQVRPAAQRRHRQAALRGNRAAPWQPDRPSTGPPYRLRRQAVCARDQQLPHLPARPPSPVARRPGAAGSRGRCQDPAWLSGRTGTHASLNPRCALRERGDAVERRRAMPVGSISSSSACPATCSYERRWPDLA